MFKPYLSFLAFCTVFVKFLNAGWLTADDSLGTVIGCEKQPFTFTTRIRPRAGDGAAAAGRPQAASERHQRLALSWSSLPHLTRTLQLGVSPQSPRSLSTVTIRCKARAALDSDHDHDRRARR